jgi:thioredoxin 1
MALAITDATFEEVVLKSDPVMVDFGQHGVVLVEWLDQLLMSWVRIRRKSCRRKVDVDANQEFAAKYGVKYSNGDFS